MVAFINKLNMTVLKLQVNTDDLTAPHFMLFLLANSRCETLILKRRDVAPAARSQNNPV